MSEFKTIPSLLGVYQETDAEKLLKERMGSEAIDITRQVVAQWSQLVAWSWLGPDDYYELNQPSSAEQENLRKAFINALKDLARSCLTEHYSPGTFIDQIVAGSDTLSQYLNGDISENGLTLPDLYQQLTGKDDYVFQKEFTQNFLWVITLDRFYGWLAGYIEENGNIKDKFVLVLAYPPRPALSPSVLTASELRDWSQGIGDGNYTPPNPYIPTCNC
jgi:hypothetical protein